MTREELVKHIIELINNAGQQADTLMATAVLSALVAALLNHSDVELASVVVSFCRSQIRETQGQWN